MPDRLLRVFGHQTLQPGLGFFVLEITRPSAGKGCSELSPSIPGRSAEECRAVRQAETKPLVEKLRAWLETRLAARLGEEHHRGGDPLWLPHWDGFVRFLDDGRIEMDTNSVERATRVNGWLVQKLDQLWSRHRLHRFRDFGKIDRDKMTNPKPFDGANRPTETLKFGHL
jgi:Transposase IS66 family